jgi:hypothetical protein
MGAKWGSVEQAGAGYAVFRLMRRIFPEIDAFFCRLGPKVYTIRRPTGARPVFWGTLGTESIYAGRCAAPFGTCRELISLRGALRRDVYAFRTVTGGTLAR